MIGYFKNEAQKFRSGNSLKKQIFSPNYLWLPVQGKNGIRIIGELKSFWKVFDEYIRIPFNNILTIQKSELAIYKEKVILNSIVEISKI